MGTARTNRISGHSTFSVFNFTLHLRCIPFPMANRAAFNALLPSILSGSRHSSIRSKQELN